LSLLNCHSELNVVIPSKARNLLFLARARIPA
jgi:hypothetical protein